METHSCIDRVSSALFWVPLNSASRMWLQSPGPGEPPPPAHPPGCQGCYCCPALCAPTSGLPVAWLRVGVRPVQAHPARPVFLGGFPSSHSAGRQRTATSHGPDPGCRPLPQAQTVLPPGP